MTQVIGRTEGDGTTTLQYRPSARAKIIARRTYNRPLNEEGTKFETWEQTVDRVIDHQRWLWERQLDAPLHTFQEQELHELRILMYQRKVSMSGRTLWLGGTKVAQEREASQFNCSFLKVDTVYDVVDTLWLLLQGCGVGFTPVVGTLNGFSKPIPKVSVINSVRTAKGGLEHNEEEVVNGVWTIKVGDSAEAWAKSIGKLMAGKFYVDELVLDFSELRPAGERLKGYGWISSGDAAIAKAYVAIAEILNRRAGQMLSRIDILDVVNWLGTILSSRRSAQIALFHVDEPEWQEFAVAKKDWYLHNIQRGQSNNSLAFMEKPSREQLSHIFDLMEDAGGSEPGFINGQVARQRAPWWYGCNPCVEILLGNKSFCNLTEVDIAKFKGDQAGLLRALRIAGRANYRQTCVNLLDGILQEAWHLNNEFLRLCGVGLTGICQRDDLSEYDLKQMQLEAVTATYSMADELGTQRPKNTTCVKPSGTLSKIMDTTEGIHKPLGKYIFNNVNFGKDDPLIPKLRAAGYNVFPNPTDPEGILCTFPVKWDDVEFTKVKKTLKKKVRTDKPRLLPTDPILPETYEIVEEEIELEVNTESALTQLERYKKYQLFWTQQNTSVTISYDPSEVDGIIDWLMLNWECYVGVSFLYRADPSKSAADLGYLYLPQEVVTKEQYEEYSSRLLDVDLSGTESFDEIETDECEGGVCPVK